MPRDQARRPDDVSMSIGDDHASPTCSRGHLIKANAFFRPIESHSRSLKPKQYSEICWCGPWLARMRTLNDFLMYSSLVDARDNSSSQRRGETVGRVAGCTQVSSD